MLLSYALPQNLCGILISGTVFASGNKFLVNCRENVVAICPLYKCTAFA